MRPSPAAHSLLTQFALRVIVPLTLVMAAMLAAGQFAYQQAIASLLIDRDQQLATLATAYVSEALASYTRELTGLAAMPAVRGAAPEPRAAALAAADQAAPLFTAGIVVVDAAGVVVAVAPPQASPVGPSVAGQRYFESVRERRAPAYSDVLVDARTGRSLVVIAVPILDEAAQLTGALLGAVDLEHTSFSAPIDNLKIGDGGFVYLVDGRGRVILHPLAENIGADYSDRPHVQNVTAGETGGALWRARSGEEVVQGYAPVANTDWGLIVREPWESVVAPTRTYGALMALTVAAAVGVTAYWLWLGVRRIAAPLRALMDQTGRLARGETVQPVAASGVREIDALERAFSQMATQMASYRAGLRRYVDALTRSQEDERRRIARELHDETIQNLLTIVRRLELLQASAPNPDRQAKLAELQALMADTVQGVRQISRDLRPPILEDLGLIPALQTLVRAAHTGQGAVPHATLEVAGQVADLSPEQELALYRVTQEALANIRRHAQATGLQVQVAFAPGLVRLEVNDDGQGFQAPAALTELAQRDSFGLLGIQERVRALGGSLSLCSAPGQGTRLTVSLPLQPSANPS